MLQHYLLNPPSLRANLTMVARDPLHTDKYIGAISNCKAGPVLEAQNNK
jgi:hypothetical protein